VVFCDSISRIEVFQIMSIIYTFEFGLALVSMFNWSDWAKLIELDWTVD